MNRIRGLNEAELEFFFLVEKLNWSCTVAFCDTESTIKGNYEDILIQTKQKLMICGITRFNVEPVTIHVKYVGEPNINYTQHFSPFLYSRSFSLLSSREIEVAKTFSRSKKESSTTLKKSHF